MITVLIIIFVASILVLLSMVSFRAWEIKTSKIEQPKDKEKLLPKIYFRHLEKIMLYLTKYAVQWVILITVKYWFILYTKICKWVKDKSPKINKFFNKKSGEHKPNNNSFLHKAVIESKIKIRNMKEKIIKEHEKELEKGESIDNI